jgi:hypothetical protein
MGLRGDARNARELEARQRLEEEAQERRRKVAWLRERLKVILPAEYHERMVDKPDWTALEWYEQRREAGVDAPMPADIQPRPVVQIDDILFTEVYASGSDIRLMDVCPYCGDPVVDYAGICHDADLSEIGRRLDTYPWLHTCRTVLAEQNNDTCPFLSIGSDSWQACLKEKCRIFEKVEQECPFRLIGQFISVEFVRAATREG